ncbi:hypothetical protein QVD17_13464 [Tagetes erecta]|uniref:Uncharacterized protein n=1 Tax=Tagetes erecta TaxID=13708 RepID=A0AAD8KX37_TARER|nr:hypothetical protein QVD17_13464 [Tagetes erecta]
MHGLFLRICHFNPINFILIFHSFIQEREKKRKKENLETPSCCLESLTQLGPRISKCCCDLEPKVSVI